LSHLSPSSDADPKVNQTEENSDEAQQQKRQENISEANTPDVPAQVRGAFGT
jgi:hypothetical protein